MKNQYGWLPVILGTTTVLICTAPARADVVGRLLIVVKNADTEKPVPGSVVTLKDSAGVRSDLVLTPGDSGDAVTTPLENRSFTLSVRAEGFTTDERTVTVIADTTTDVVVELDPAEKTIKITGAKNLLRPRATTDSASRSADFLKRYPITATNPQQLQGVVASTPGFALDSNNQAHPRGEHTQTALYIGGFQLGGALTGRFGPLIVPDALENIEVQTGSYAPEYGSETAAILNTTIKQGTIQPTGSLEGGFGGFSTRQGSLSLGGQFGGPLLQKAAGDKRTGPVAQKFRYFLNSTYRTTDNALDAPQPDNQSAHNKGTAESYLGRFDYVPDGKNTFTLTLNDAPGKTGVANRTGLSDKYAGVGQGYGFGGFASRADALASGNPLLAETQQQAGQDINQKDDNRFGILQYRHTFSDQLTGLISLGGTNSKLDVTNGNPAFYNDLSTLSQRPDAAVEFSPTVSRTGKNSQLEGSLTYALDKHTVKVGLSTDQQKGSESYQLLPGSQLALNALFAAAPQLAGFTEGGQNNLGTPQVDGSGNPVMDANGNQVYTLNAGVSTLPAVAIKRTGYYRVAYAQDTWRLTPKLTANYGLRLDMFKRDETSGSTPFSFKQNFLSPRMNLSYALQPGLVARASYNHLFIQPPVSEGATVGSFAQPETLNQYETSLEKQLKSNQTVKVAFYYKQIHNQLDIALLVPGAQMGIYRAVNIPRDNVHGVELSYELQPRGGTGVGGFAALTRSTCKFFDDGDSGFNDHDQRYTVTSGLSYMLKNGVSASTSVYYGSGVASSEIVGLQGRRARTKVDARLTSGPKLFGGKGGLNLDIDNMFDDRSLINFGSDFSGTRFQQGRRIVLSAFSKF